MPAMAARRYSYPRFLDSQTIRLLKFKTPCSDPDPSVTAGQPCLDVAVFKMESAPPYRALSYAWGPPEDGNDAATYAESEAMSVIIDDEFHDVMPNLFDAIVQMRESYPASYFWIDALCINQTDLHERELHVAIMDRIYHNADEVIIWLGRDTSNSSDVFDLVQRVADLDETFFHSFGYTASPEELVTYGLPDTSTAVWRRYLDLYERRWFSRGWVVQEVVLARKPIAHLGSLKVPWDVMVSGSKIFLPERLRKGFFARLRDVKDIDSLPLGRNAYRIGLIKEACFQRMAQSLLVVEICTGTHGLTSAAHFLVHLLRMSRDFSWGDPRDRIYSMLGLINFTARLHGLPPLDLKPDYSSNSTEATVLTAATQAIIKQSDFLGIIAQVSDPAFRRTQNLPSWVPDWFRSPNFAMGRRNPFDASRHRSNNMLHCQFSGQRLFVKGTRLGTFRGVHRLKMDNDIEHVISMLRIAYKSWFPLGEDRMEVLWRTLIWDIYGHAQETDEHPAPPFLEDSFVSWLYSAVASQSPQMEPAELSTHMAELHAATVPEAKQAGGLDDTRDSLLGTSKLRAALALALHCVEDGSGEAKPPLAPPQADPERFSSHASGVVWAQNLFVTDTGYLGMGPKSSQEGDELWIVAGCPFPMVLRRHVRDGEAWCFVLGRAYVHGVMHGEAVSEETVWEELCLK
ncbi:Heterokaryon incompatibility protein-like protein [Hapsidospora chrysogenum ATCC 11550]|uniref:Heterokaryon incompatibility protein-like protein n=1 Tax=Hapsidospora chrysogenum (strain ATCC 11550 / CBS 779.69 / DSM 880 / IAM 14645 / JCM 23072 / IMI 49137) TaxID=857340 RepID=A0A086TB71_HAPC1|nr:Heterokaryon incompatibility protein-like protein [Hapsidospora chrysogenum ATCC 11550]